MTLRCDLGEVITAMVTPMASEKAIDYAGVEKVARHLLSQQNDGIVVSGTTGESPTLTHEEEYEILYLTENIDEFVFQVLMDYDGNKFVNVSADNVDLSTEEEKEKLKKENDLFKGLLDFMKEAIGDSSGWRNMSQTQTRDNFSCPANKVCPFLNLTVYGQNLPVF